MKNSPSKHGCLEKEIHSRNFFFTNSPVNKFTNGQRNEPSPLDLRSFIFSGDNSTRQPKNPNSFKPHSLEMRLIIFFFFGWKKPRWTLKYIRSSFDEFETNCCLDKIEFLGNNLSKSFFNLGRSVLINFLEDLGWKKRNILTWFFVNLKLELSPLKFPPLKNCRFLAEVYLLDSFACLSLIRIRQHSQG